MKYNFSDEALPEIFIRNGRKCYLDPVRKRLIFVTPEETVRQQTIHYLIDKLHVPENMIRVEEHLSHYGIRSKKRADIIIERYEKADHTIRPLTLIECKAPGVLLGEKTAEQMFIYADLIGCDYAAMTDGRELFCYYYDKESESYKSLRDMPSYQEQLGGRYSEETAATMPPRLELAEIDSEDKWKEYGGADIGLNTPKRIAVPAVNLWEALLYTEHKIRTGEYGIFRMIRDCGIRLLSYGNASGGGFAGPYRSFLIEYKNSTEFVSLGISPYFTYAHPEIEKTMLCVGIDNEKTTHHALQLVLDDNVVVAGTKCIFYHSGKMAVGKIGSGRLDELRLFVEEQYPEIADGSRYNLGTLVNDHLWNLDEADMEKFVENVISYALVRDEYREFVKNKYTRVTLDE